MRLLLIHAEEFSFKVREKALKEAEPIKDNEQGSGKNVLVVFTTIEKNDIPDENYLNKVIDDIIDVFRKVNASMIMLYPYAHLSSNLAKPTQAIEIFNKMYNILKMKVSNVMKAPFGYYKEFTLKCYGHPLSELSRSYTPEIVKKEIPEEKIEKKDYYIVLTPEGKLLTIDEFLRINRIEELNILIEKEVLKKELPGGEEPKYLDYCKKFGFEWESLSDIGHMRYGPEATIMFELVEEYSWIVATSLGIPVFKVRGTNMFRLSSKAINEHAKLFGERLYTIETEDDVFILRYAACFQQFAMVKDWVISYRDLPFGVFEIADSYRFEQPGETVLCFRLRKFHMPDLHVFTRDIKEAKEIAIRIHEKIFNEIHKIERDYVGLYNVTEDLLNNHRDFLIKLAKIEGKPIVLHVLPEQKYYWIINIEYNIIDELRRPREIATLQIDIGNAQRFGIKYRDEKGETKYPVIIHTAIIGSIERYIFAILDKAAIDERNGKIPKLPTWLCPIQVRLIPVKNEYLNYCEKIANKLEEYWIRVDIDDRNESVSKKIREAEKSWIPYIVVVGEKELKTGKLSVRIRGIGIKEMTIEELVNTIENELKEYPKKKLTIPRRLSQRPIYKTII